MNELMIIKILILYTNKYTLQIVAL